VLKLLKFSGKGTKMKKYCSALLMVTLILFMTTPVFAGGLAVFSYDPSTALAFGGGLLCFAKIGNRRFLKR
jgi:hypothetical protein